MTKMDRHHDYVREWLTDERKYQMEKFSTEQDDEHTRNYDGSDDWWYNQVMDYLYRAHQLGLDNPNGRQALAKAVATAHGFLESAVRVYGPLPEPGVPSGYNLDKLRSVTDV